jgi:hypothetical protein
MWEPRRLTTLWSFMACYMDSFTFSLFIKLAKTIPLFQKHVTFLSLLHLEYAENIIHTGPWYSSGCLELDPHHRAWGSILYVFMAGSGCMKCHWSSYYFDFLQLLPANHHSTLAPYSSVTIPLRYAMALTRQHIITILRFYVAVFGSAPPWLQSNGAGYDFHS